ncbi:hypothetical protein RhiirA5_427861 [Rhizophagus irregularis]|uniref:Uncharacterized protein n=1 Tax=Rhizophagus irregularis TaxID=588596 RepID=A0A2N0P1D9_9GLOM|nr:hypothetical protein RhiirA5_427861 [Rhizophagus irregularis]
MIDNKALAPIKEQILNGDIDWTFTKEWLNYNPSDTPCSAKLSKDQGNKKKKCNFIYPTIDIQQRNYPHLYPFGTYPEGNNLLQLIKDNIKEVPHALEATISSSRFFDTNFNGPLPITHPCYLKHHSYNTNVPRIQDNPTDPQPRRAYTHRRVASSPYSREGGFYNDRAHIRWTSSNFLHSRHWTSHRDNFWFDNIDLFSFLNNNFLGNLINTR